MRSPLTTVEQNDHVAAAAYLMKHAGATAVTVLDPRTSQPVGIITEADVAHAVADGKDVNTTRIFELMTTRPTVINTTTSVREAAEVMTSGHFRHLPVIHDGGLVGIVDMRPNRPAPVSAPKSRSPTFIASAAMPRNCRLVKPVSKVNVSWMAVDTASLAVNMSSNKCRAAIAPHSSAAACGPDPHADVGGDRTLNS